MEYAYCAGPIHIMEQLPTMRQFQLVGFTICSLYMGPASDSGIFLPELCFINRPYDQVGYKGEVIKTPRSI